MQKLLTITEVAKILRISETTAKIWASQRVFPVVKIGRLIRISPQALEDWILKKTEQSRAEAFESDSDALDGRYDTFLRHLKRVTQEDKK